MSNDQSSTGGFVAPPSSDGRAVYWLENLRLISSESQGMETVPDLLKRAIRMTAQLVAHWADHYEAEIILQRPLIDRRRKGTFPRSRPAREALVKELFNWLEMFGEPLTVGVVYLFRDNTPLFLIQDGACSLFLEPDEFVNLQEAWERDELPRNLFYPKSALRTILQPIEKHGGIVWSYKSYTPLEWSHRQKEAELSQVPSEQQRIQTFVEVCERFAQAIRLRIAELSEPGRELDEEGIERLRRLHQEANLAARWAREALLPDGEERSE